MWWSTLTALYRSSCSFFRQIRGQNTVHVVLQHIRELPGCMVILTVLYRSCFSAISVRSWTTLTVHVVLEQIRDLPGCVVTLTAFYLLVSPPNPWTTLCTLSSNTSEICLVVVIFTALYPLVYPPDPWTTHWIRCPTHQRFAWFCGDHGITSCMLSSNRSESYWLHGDSHGVVLFLFLRQMCLVVDNTLCTLSSNRSEICLVVW